MSDMVTITEPKLLPELNSVLARGGMSARCVMILPTEGVDFNRSADPEVVARSYGLATGQVGASGIAVSSRFKVEEGGANVRYAAGAAYASNDSNPNLGLGLVQAGRRTYALGVPFSDAPAAVVVHATTGMTAVVAGVAHTLRVGTVAQTVELLERQVRSMGYNFFREDLWVMLSPGARHGYEVNGRMVKVKLAALPQELVNNEEILRSIPDRDEETYSLDLALLFKRLWEREDVPERQIDFDERNTLTERDAVGQFVLPSRTIATQQGLKHCPSGLLAIGMRFPSPV